jgi:putative transposase
MLNDMKTMADRILKAWSGKVIEMEGESDHVHLIISYPPSKKLSNLVGNLKGSITKQLWYTYEDRLKSFYWKKRVLWTPSYFVASCGGVTVEQLKEYVQQQEKPST